MGITMQSFVGIGHSVDFWRSADLAAENHPPPAENPPPSVVNISPQQKILTLQQRYLRYKVVFVKNQSIYLFLHFFLVRHVHGDHHAKFRGNRT